MPNGWWWSRSSSAYCRAEPWYNHHDTLYITPSNPYQGTGCALLPNLHFSKNHFWIFLARASLLGCRASSYYLRAWHGPQKWHRWMDGWSWIHRYRYGINAIHRAGHETCIHCGWWDLSPTILATWASRCFAMRKLPLWGGLCRFSSAQKQHWKAGPPLLAPKAQRQGTLGQGFQRVSAPTQLQRFQTPMFLFSIPPWKDFSQTQAHLPKLWVKLVQIIE